ncbi:MAG: A/G-specific adenine glycosylase [Bacteroidota bacterium]
MAATFLRVRGGIFLSYFYPMSNWPAFRTNLLSWYRPERRRMPWKESGNPYRVWLSEIILQQTRVEQGKPYYERFVATYPTVKDLAAAEDDAVMKLWEGLGYYSRARNLLKAARVVANEHDGQFPDTYAGLLSLPGVGPYTAAAIASFAFGRQVPVLDGNVFRILARYAADATPIDTTAGKKHYQRLVERAIGDDAEATPAARFNQAIMDFGALVCTPRNAGCPTCPLVADCKARASKQVYELPRKEKKLKRRDRHFHYLVLKDEAERTVIQQRTGKDIWQSLYQFPLVETAATSQEVAALALHPDWPDWLPAGELDFVRSSPPFRQQLTHQTIIATFHTFTWRLMPGEIADQQILNNKMLNNFAFPRVITRFLADKSLLLNLF